MFCPKCGKELADGMKFCMACGHRMPDAGNSIVSQNKTVKQSESVPKNNKKLIIVIAAAAVVVLAVVLLLGKSSSDGTGFNSCEDVVNNYILAVENKDKDRFLDCFQTDQREYVEKDIIEWRKTLETDVFDETYNPDVNSNFRFLIVNDRYEVTCTAGDKEIMTKDELDSFNSNDYGYTVKEGYKVEFEVAQSWAMFDGTSTRRDSSTLYVGKIGKKWFVLEPLEYNWVVD